MVSLIPFMALFCACPEPSTPGVIDSGSGFGSPTEIAGSIAKGPFIAGSRVDASELASDTLLPTGSSFRTDTTSVLGEFVLSLPEGPVDLQTSGFYFNEVTNLQSEAAIELRALVEVSPTITNLYVNALTHIARRRALYLATVGDSSGKPLPLAQAIEVAESDAREALPNLVSPPSPAAATEVNVLQGDNADTAYLLALSCTIIQSAVDPSAPDTTDAQIQSLLNDFALDLEADGELEPSLTDRLQVGARELDPVGCHTHMEAFLAAQGILKTAPDPNAALDYDDDGIPDASDDDADGDGVAAALDLPTQIQYMDYRSAWVRDGSGTLWSVEGWGTYQTRRELSIQDVAWFAAPPDRNQGPILVQTTGGTVQVYSSLAAPPVNVTGLPALGVRSATFDFERGFVLLGEDGSLYELRETAAERIGSATDIIAHGPGVPASPLSEGGFALASNSDVVVLGTEHRVTPPSDVPTLVDIATGSDDVILLAIDGTVWKMTAETTSCQVDDPSGPDFCEFSFDRVAFPAKTSPAGWLGGNTLVGLTNGEVWDVGPEAPVPYRDLANVVAFVTSPQLGPDAAVIFEDGTLGFVTPDAIIEQTIPR